MTAVDDLWLASYLISQGAELATVAVIPYRNGRLTAVFHLENVSMKAMDSYANGDPAVKVHALRAAINRLRDLMYRELQKKNGTTKKMPNGQRPDGQRRCGDENRSGCDR